MPERSPLVSICIPTFNAAGTLERTLRSILAQDHPNLEVCVVDNASTDGTPALARAVGAGDPRLRVLEHDENVGGEGNFTRCLRLGRGEYTAIFHADDLYEHDMVSRQVRFLEDRPTAGAVFVAARDIDEHDAPIGDRFLPPEVFADHGGVLDFRAALRLVLRHGNFFVCSSALARTAVYRDEIRVWNGARFKTSADLDVWFRILARHEIGFLPERLIRYRVSAASFSYHYARERTAPHDIFLPLEAYVTGPARVLLSETDRACYRLLRQKDQANRAINRLIAGDSEGARDLLTGHFRVGDALRGVRSLRQARFVAIACATWLLSRFELPVWLRERIRDARYPK